MHARREAHGRAKLTEIKVAKIREAINKGIFLKELSQKYGVGISTISDIKLNKSWPITQIIPVYKFNSRPLEERFWKKVKKSNISDCWIWSGFKNPHGYGGIEIKGGMALAHRVAWELTYGKVPEELYVLHHCDNPTCVNPSHLFLGTQADNIRDMCLKGRSRHSTKYENPSI